MEKDIEIKRARGRERDKRRAHVGGPSNKTQSNQAFETLTCLEVTKTGKQNHQKTLKTSPGPENHLNHPNRCTRTIWGPRKPIFTFLGDSHAPLAAQGWFRLVLCPAPGGFDWCFSAPRWF